jgi:GntR family transcriptional regulator of vanillate catabolism
LREARASQSRIDELLREPALDDAGFSRYVAFNEQFHALLSELSGSSVIAQQLERVVNLPFASPSGFVVVRANSPAARDMLVIAQDQHRQVLDAIEAREGSRAEALMREHSRIAQRNLRDVLHGSTDHSLPGVQLIRRRS